MSYFVVFPIVRRPLGLEIKGFSKPSEALADAEEKSARFPLVIVVEDFGEGQRMGLLKVHVANEDDLPDPDDWTESILSSYGGAWETALVNRAWMKADSATIEKKLQFIGPQPRPKPFILYPIDTTQQVIEREIRKCDSAQHADDLLAIMQLRFPAVVVIDVNFDSDDGPYPLYTVGNVTPGLVCELALFGRSRDKELAEIEAAIAD